MWNVLTVYTVPREVYQQFTLAFEKYPFVDNTKHGKNWFWRITRDHILSSLKKQGLKRYYKDVHLIHCEFTGIPPIDINEEVDGLVNDFRVFTNEYNKHLAKILRQFLNLHHILYQL